MITGHEMEAETFSLFGVRLQQLNSREKDDATTTIAPRLIHLLWDAH
jgi:hypothetical protein